MAAAAGTAYKTSPLPSNHSRPRRADPHHLPCFSTVRFSSSSPSSSSSSSSSSPKPSFPKTLATTSAASSVAAESEPSPLFRSLTSFAPATVANLGPGFDFLGVAVDALGDTVTVSVDPSVPPGILSISSISSSSSSSSSGPSRLTRDPLRNCAGIAAAAAMRMLGVRSVGLSLRLVKGLPLGSGLGSSAASAAAAAVAVNALFGGPLSPADLVLAGLESEAKVSGYHADNVGPAILGGFVLIRSYDPLDLVPLEFPSGRDLFFVLASPAFEAPTKKMRAALPAGVSMKEHVRNASQAAALVAAVARGDARALGAAMSSDAIVEPRRAPLIPGMAAVKAAAVAAGAFGCTISGAGPTAVAVIDGEEKGREIGERMVEAFSREGGLNATATVASLDRVGARVISSSVE
ncbi:Homoserine kinase [Ananas comosus]|uniref:Homoserine kinase n=1 Tax=Ananas comosus TaxID=4615 RepID=A0A199W3K1_ANACO|nr:Homoserine kinase [Ananas comosus]